MVDTWTLIKNDQFDEACRMADLEYQQTGRIASLFNKYHALMHLKKYNEAIALANQLIKITNGETDADFIFSAISHWLLNKKKEAVDLWLLAEKCKYTDAAGGIEIYTYEYFAAVKMNDEKLKKWAVRGIKRLLKDRKSINWPGPIGHYLLDEMPPHQLLSLVSDIPIIRERQLCQSNFVIAIKELEHGNETAYYRHLQDCIKDGSLAYLEDMYDMAKGELERSV